jgi:hypothetical protein
MAAVGVCVLLVGLALVRSAPSDPSGTPTRVPSGSVELQIPLPPTPGVSVGVPDRTRRSKAGAVDAGAHYATLLAQLFPLDGDHARAVVADAASDEARSRLVAAIDANLLPLQQQAGDLSGVTTYRQAVLATHLVSYSADAPASAGTVHQPATAAGAWARVTVWTLLTVSRTPWAGAGTTQAGDNASNAIGSFGTVHLDLTWQRGAWRIDDSTTLDGPTPLVDGTPSTGTQLNSALKGFQDWRPE